MTDLEIINMYTIQEQSTHQIADQIGAYANKIKRILLKYGIKLRTKSEAQRAALKQKRSRPPMTGEHHSDESKQKISDTRRFKVKVERNKDGKT